MVQSGSVIVLQQGHDGSITCFYIKMSVCPDVSAASAKQAHEGSAYLKVTEPPGKDVFRGEKMKVTKFNFKGNGSGSVGQHVYKQRTVFIAEIFL